MVRNEKRRMDLRTDKDWEVDSIGIKRNVGWTPKGSGFRCMATVFHDTINYGIYNAQCQNPANPGHRYCGTHSYMQERWERIRGGTEVLHPDRIPKLAIAVLRISITPVEEALDTVLTEVERSVVIQRWGLSDGNPKTLEEVGRWLKPPKTRERVRQIEARALAKISAHWGMSVQRRNSA